MSGRVKGGQKVKVKGQRGQCRNLCVDDLDVAGGQLLILTDFTITAVIEGTSAKDFNEARGGGA